MVRYQREREWLANELKANRRLAREASRPTGTETSLTTETAQEALDAAGTAQGDAEQAVVDAAAALETALGSARYSQVDGGPIVPALPGDGPRTGAELVHVDAGGHPYQVDVWDGSAWVKAQYLADQILVLGEDGTVQIENGRVIAPEIIGGEMTSGTFRISDYADPSGTYSNDGSDLTGWSGDNGTSLSVVTSPVYSGTNSIKAESTGNEVSATVTFTAITAQFAKVAVRIRPDRASTFYWRMIAFVNGAAGQSFAKIIEADVWTEIEFTFELSEPVNTLTLAFPFVSTSGEAVYIDSLVVDGVDANDSGVVIDRDEDGRASFRALDPYGDESVRIDYRGLVTKNVAAFPRLKGTSAEFEAYKGEPSSPEWGTEFYVTDTGRTWRYGGSGWIIEDDITNDDGSTTNALPGTKVGSRTIDYATLEVRSGWIFISMQQTGNMATGTVELWSGLPAKFRPDYTVTSTANLANYPCIAVVRPNGTIAVVNQSGATRTWGMMSFAYPIPR